MFIRKIKTSIVFILFLVISAFFCVPSEATLSLSVSPIRGGSSLRFGRVDSAQIANQEVRIRVTSDQGEQYQIYQSMVEPLSNERGEILRPAALGTYSITGSNSMGTLYLQQMTTMKNVDDLLYTSNGTGQSDSITTVYAIDPAQIDASGRFSGKILFTLRPVSGGNQVQAFLDVFLEVPEDFKVQTQASTGRDLVKLTPKSLTGAEGYFKISFSGNVGEDLGIYQEIDQLPVDETGKEIGKDVLHFFVEPAQEAEVQYTTPTAFTKRAQIYLSKKPNDNVIVHYLLNEEALLKQKAGVYKGQVKYSLERKGVIKTVFLNLEILIDPVFQIEVTFPEGEPRFDNILPNSPPQIKETVVEVKTNLSKPYLIIQKIPAPLANEKGGTFKEQFFDMKVEAVEGSGKSSFGEFSPVPQEEKTIFQSGPKGEPCKVKVLYRLKPYPEMDAGNYLTSIVYSLGEI